MDQTGADLLKTMDEIKNRLSEHCILFDKKNETFFEQTALCDETVLEKYLETGAVTDQTICQLAASRKLFPCYSGSALKMQGVEPVSYTHLCPFQFMGIKKSITVVNSSK